MSLQIDRIFDNYLIKNYSFEIDLLFSIIRQIENIISTIIMVAANTNGSAFKPINNAAKEIKTEKNI